MSVGVVLESTSTSRPGVLYLSYTGLLEPLGRSQILPYLERLSERYSIVLVTFEKPENVCRNCDVDELREICASHNIVWLFHRYHRTPRIPATVWDVAVLVSTVRRLFASGCIHMIHSRGYVAAVGAYLAKKTQGIRFLFDMRGLWPREMVAAGTLRKDSLTFRALMGMEKALVANASAIVALTEVSAMHIRAAYPETSQTLFAVIPTCVELERFKCRRSPPKLFTVGVMGSVSSGLYRLDSLFLLFRLTQKAIHNSRLKIVTMDRHAFVLAEARKNGINTSCVIVESAKPQCVGVAIADMSFGALFYRGGIGQSGSLPTRLAEFLASGIPVMANRSMCFATEVVEKHGVGVVVDSLDAVSLERGLASMVALLDDPAVAQRCRAVAESEFSVDSGAERYGRVYEHVLAGISNAVHGSAFEP